MVVVMMRQRGGKASADPNLSTGTANLFPSAQVCVVAAFQDAIQLTDVPAVCCWKRDEIEEMIGLMGVDSTYM